MNTFIIADRHVNQEIICQPTFTYRTAQITGDGWVMRYLMLSQLLAIAIALEPSPFHWLILIELFGQVIGLRRQQYLVLAGTKHAMLCMRDWAQCVGSRWELACVLGLMCRIPLGTAPTN